MTTQFAAGRDSVLAPAVYVSTGGSIQGDNSVYYFWLQARSRCGYNKPSQSFSISIPNNSIVSIVIPGTSFYASEDWHEFLVYTNTTNNFSTSRLVGTYSALETDQKTKRALGSDTPLSTDPKQLTLTLDTQLNFSSTVVNPAGLPVNPINGSRRFVASLSRTYRYSATSIATPNSDTVLTASTGRWLFTESNNLIENPINLTTNINGCNQNINAIANNPDLIFATYDCIGNIGTPIKFYLKSASNVIVPKGTIIAISVRVDSIDVTQDFSGLLDVIVYGKVRTSDYALVTTNFLSAGSVVPYNNNTKNIILEDDLLPNEYLLVSVTPRFSTTDIDTNITPSVGLSLYPYFGIDQSVYADNNLTVGDIIFNEYDNRVVVPYGLGDLKVLGGSGCINLYTWRNKPSTILTGYTTNTAGQSVLVTRIGDVLLGTPSSIQLRRSYFSTVTGYSTPCNFSTPTALSSGQTIQYTLNIEQDIEGYNPISPVYTDRLLRGLVNRAKLNTNKLIVIVKLDTVYKKFLITFDPTLATITGTIADWGSGVVLTTGEIASFNKNLFKPLEAIHTVTGTGGNIPTGSVSIAYSFFYDGTAVSDISHNTEDNCIPTQVISAADIGSRYLYWGEGVADIAGLRTIEKNGDNIMETRYVASKRHPYHYDSASTLNDNGDTVIKPNDITASGRWLSDYSNVWYTGTTVPNNGLGAFGDWYLKSNTSDLYRKEDSGEWVLNSNIRGLGTKWFNGSGVPSNTLGIDGDYYYQTSTSDIYVKTGGTYTVIGSVKGQQGSVWRNGTGIPSDVLGIDGDYYLDTTTSLIYAKNTGVYTVVGSFVVGSGGSPYAEVTSDLTTTSNTSYLFNGSANRFITLHTPSIAGEVEKFVDLGTGTVNISGLVDPTQLDTLPIDFYLKKNSYIDLVWSGTSWFYDSSLVQRGIRHGGFAHWSFSTSSPLSAEFGAYTFYSLVDSGTIPITYTAGLLAPYALNFDNATAGYKLTFASGNFGGADIVGGVITFVVNYTSSSDELVLSNKISAGGYIYSLNSITATTIRLSFTTSSGSFYADCTVANAYSQNLVIACIDTNTNTISLQVNNGTITTTSYTGTIYYYTSTEGIVLGQETAGNQFTGVIDRFWIYWRDLDVNQRSLLWNNGSFI